MLGFTHVGETEGPAASPGHGVWAPHSLSWDRCRAWLLLQVCLQDPLCPKPASRSLGGSRHGFHRDAWSCRPLLQSGGLVAGTGPVLVSSAPATGVTRWGVYKTKVFFSVLEATSLKPRCWQDLPKVPSCLAPLLVGPGSPGHMAVFLQPPRLRRRAPVCLPCCSKDTRHWTQGPAHYPA